MGDEPVLDAKARYYQRLLARDQDEAADIVEEYLQRPIPAKPSTMRCCSRPCPTPRVTGCATRSVEADAQFVVRATHEIIQELGQDATRTGERVRPANDG